MKPLDFETAKTTGERAAAVLVPGHQSRDWLRPGSRWRSWVIFFAGFGVSMLAMRVVEFLAMVTR